jgi:integrase/recombinase XerD
MNFVRAFSVKFFLYPRRKKAPDKVPIYMRVTVNRKKCEVFLAEYADPVKWDDSKGRIKNPNRLEAHVNNKLLDVESKVVSRKYELERANKPVTAKDVVQIFKGRKKAEDITLLAFAQQVILEKEANRQEITYPVVYHYKQMKNKLELYLKSIKSQDILLRDFKRLHVAGFEHFMLTSIVETLNQPLRRNTVSKHLTKLRATLNRAVVAEIILVNPFQGFRIKLEKTQRRFLSKVELELLSKHPLSGNEALIRVRDAFVFSCYTGLRYGDARHLKASSVKEDSDGRLWIMTTQLKTGDPVEIPMLSKAREVYDKYATYRAQTGYVLNMPSNQKVNRHLTEIARLLDLPGKLTHHSARHTFSITVMLENGIDLKVLSRMLGHSSLSSTQVYGKITRTLLSAVAKKVDSEEG